MLILEKWKCAYSWFWSRERQPNLIILQIFENIKIGYPSTPISTIINTNFSHSNSKILLYLNISVPQTKIFQILKSSIPHEIPKANKNFFPLLSPFAPIVASFVTERIGTPWFTIRPFQWMTPNYLKRCSNSSPSEPMLRTQSRVF